MELQQVIATRRSVREFSDKPISHEIIDKALRAGLKAPSHNHLKQWDFILVKDLKKRLALTQTQTMVETVTDELKLAFNNHEALAKEMYLYAVPMQKKMILTAPELLVVVYKPKTKVIDSHRVSDLNCLAAVWCCIENIVLSLAEENIFGVTAVPQNTPGIKEVLNIPQELEVAALIPFGYQADAANVIPQKEVQLESRLHINEW